ncbi:MAG: FecR domain-containing protein [Spirochaetota bacterium]
MKHLDELTLLSLAQNSLHEDDANKAILHIQRCSICSKKLQLIQTTITSQKPVEPSRDILSSILQYHSKVEQKKESLIDTIYKFIQTYTLSLGLSVAILFMGIVIALIIFKPDHKFIPHILYITAKTNYRITTQTITEGHRIIIKENDSAILIAHCDIKFRLTGGVDLIIEKSRYNRTIAKKKFEYILTNGIANIKSYGSHDTMYYEIKTPDAVIQPLGTEFYINVSSEGTNVYIVEGKVILKNNTTSETIEAEMGKSYTISKNEIISFDVEKYALQWINDIDASFEKLFNKTDLGEYSSINSNINNNSGKESTRESKIEDVTIPDIDKANNILKNKNDTQDIKELHNEMHQLKKDLKHKQMR